MRAPFDHPTYLAAGSLELALDRRLCSVTSDLPVLHVRPTYFVHIPDSRSLRDETSVNVVRCLTSTTSSSSWNAPPLNLLSPTFLMLELLPPRPMPHATTSDSPVDLLPRWQTLKDVSITLPRPHAHQLLPPKPNVVTPPSDMNGVASNSNIYSQYHATMGAEDTGYEFRPKIPAIQPALYPQSTSSTKYGSSYRPPGSTETGSPLQKPSVPAVNNEDQTGRRSSAGNSNAVAPSLRIPHTVQAPQSSMPQLAAEVRILNLTWKKEFH